jgi:hypothetical protein
MQAIMKGDFFTKANRLWFREGRTAAALRAYQEALRAAPADPVVAFQLARVLWSLDRFDEARAALAQAFAHRDALSPVGLTVIESFQRRIQSRPQRYYPEFPPELLDRDRLETGASEVSDWRTVADAAASRDMFGLAVYALDRWTGTPIDAEDSKDIDRIETRRGTDERMLSEMRAGRRTGKNIVPQAGTAKAPDVRDISDSRDTRDLRGPLRPAEAPTQPLSPRSGAVPSHPESSKLPDLPLDFSLRIFPSEGPVGVETTLAATLTNPAPVVQVVNSRMLVNHVGQPGEVWLHVQGPPGYRNHVGYRVRAGQAPPEFFVSLAPGASVEQSWTLNQYQSMETPGEYILTATYHNETQYAPDGRGMVVGKVSATIRFHRSVVELTP